MRTIHKLLTGLLLLSGVSVSAQPQLNLTPSWSKVENSDFVSRANNAQQTTGERSNQTFYKGDTFILNVSPTFFPEKFGAYAGQSGHTSTEINPTTFDTMLGGDQVTDKQKSINLFNNSISSVYMLTGIDAQEHKRKHKIKLASSEDTYVKYEGRLYAYKGDLSRFFFIERNSTIAYTGGGGSNKRHNPYKWTSNSGGHLVPNNDAGFCEYGVDPSDMTVGSTEVKRAITIDWQDAIGSGTATPLDDKLKQMSNNFYTYGCVAMTHDCSGGTMRSHFLHAKAPDVTNNPYPEGPQNQITVNRCNNFAATVPDAQETTILLFVPKKDNLTKWEDWVHQVNNDYRIQTPYCPYIQYYLAKFVPYSETIQGETTIKNGCYEDNLTATQIDHNLLWFTNVHDKLCPDYAKNSGKYPGDQGYTQPSTTYKCTPETYKVYYRYSYEDDKTENWKERSVFFGDETDANKHGFKVHTTWDRADDTYYVVYKVVCIIDDLGVSCESDQVTLKVPGKKAVDKIKLDVESSSVPHDNMNYGTTTEGVTDNSFGYNEVSHHLDISFSDEIIEIGGNGTYTITRNYKNSATDPTTWPSEVITFTKNGTTYSCSKEGFEYGEDKDYYFSPNGHLYVNWPTAHNIDYAINGYGWDKYKVEFVSRDKFPVEEGSEETDNIRDNTDFVIAPYYRTAFGTNGVNSTIISEREIEKTVGGKKIKVIEYTYEALDMSIFDGCGAFQYLVRKGGQQEGTSGKWKDGGSSQTENAKVQVQTKQEVISEGEDETTLYFCGYIEYNNIRGIWGVGDANTSHKAKQLHEGAIVCTVKPHNQVIEVAMEEGGANPTNPIWNYPGAKTTTKQIFPGVDFEIRGNRLYRSRDYKTTYNVAFGLVIYEKKQGATTWTKHYINGQQYFSQIVDGTKDQKDERNNICIPDFEVSTPVSTEVQYVTETQNVIYDFQNTNCKYDAFVFYVNPVDKKVVSYAHTGYGKISETAAYDTDAYIEQLESVIGEDVNFKNTVGDTPGTQFIQLGDGDVKAYRLYEGNTKDMQDGFAYVVLDLDKAIPNQDANFDPEHKNSNSDDLRPAITSYKVTATQDNNEGLQVFYPTLGQKDEDDFDIDEFEADDKPTIEGLDWKQDPTDKLQVYADINSNIVADLVEGLHPTGSETTERLTSTTNNYVLVGLRYIDKTLYTGSTRAPHKTVAPSLPDHLANMVRIFVEPEYTFVQPEKPVYSFGDKYVSTVNPQYATDVPEVATIDEDGDDATPNATPNLITEKINPNNTVARQLGYLANKLIDLREKAQNIGREMPLVLSNKGIVSAVDDVKVDDNVKVFADGRDIVVEGAEGEVIVFNAYGQSVYAGHSSRIAMAQPGVYLVAANGSIYKVFVK